LTVIGSNLDAVGTPQMTVTLKEITAQNETGDIITYPPQVGLPCFNAYLQCLFLEKSFLELSMFGTVIGTFSMLIMVISYNCEAY